MENIKDLILFKPNELIGIEGGYVTNINRLAYNYIIHRLQIEGSHYARINIADFFNDLNLGKNYDELILYLDSLQKIRVVSRDNKGKLWGAFNLLSYFKQFDDGTVHVEIPSIIFKALCNQDKFYYTTIKLLEQKSFKCSYSPVFYEFFKKYEKVNIPNILLKDLKKITGCLNKYEKYKDFKRDVLLKSLQEINQIDKKYEYSFEEKRLGRKVNEIKFIRTEKNMIDVVSEPQISEKLLKAIAKARKNRFVDSSYSQKSMDKIISMYDEKDIIKALGELYKYNSEIINFQKMLISKIDDVKRSKIPLKPSEEKNIRKDTLESSDSLKIDLNVSQKVLVEISKEDYECLYEKYLKDNDVPHMKSVRMGFDKMNSTKYKIVI